MSTLSIRSTETQRYLRYGQLLNGGFAVLATALGIWILVSPDRRTDPNWLYWLVLTMATLHTVEEYIIPGGFMAWFNQVVFRSPKPDYPLTAKRAFMTDGIAAAMTAPVLVLVGSQFLPLVFVFAMLRWINGYFHIAETIKTGKYSPGVLTVLLLETPGLLYITQFYLSRGLITPLALALAFAIALGLTAIFFRQVRVWMREPA